MERDVALKILRAGTLADEAARKRYRKEALALSKVDHPNIATTYDFDTDSGMDFLAIEPLIAGAVPQRIVARTVCRADRLGSAAARA